MQAEATLQVFSTTWAVIYVDGKRIDVTPVTVKVPPGTHQLRAEHDGLVPVEHTVTLGPGESGRWSPQLRTPK